MEGQVRAEGTAISSTPYDDVDMLDGQDQETVAGSGTHLGFAQKRTKVKNSDASAKVTTDILHSLSLLKAAVVPFMQH